MALMDNLEKRFESQISTLPEKEQKFFRGIKDNVLGIYNKWLKPIIIGIFMFWLFTKVKNAVGIEETVIIQLTVIIIYLRLLNSKLG